jgi:hypothetical protein
MESRPLVAPSSLLRYGQGQLRPAVDRGAALLDAVHLVPAWRTINVRAFRRPGGHIGSYHRHSSLAINTYYSEQTRVGALLHEYGHFIDQALLPGLSFTSTHESGPLKEVIALCVSSAPAGELRDGASRWTPGRPNWRKHRDGWLELQSPVELFARAYTQWVAGKSADAELVAFYATERPKDGDHAQRWSTEEFAPIATALDAAFTSLGWLL